MTTQAEWDKHIDALLRHVAGGNTAKSYCVAHKLDYSNLHAYLDLHGKRALYDTAFDRRMLALEDDLQDLSDIPPTSGTDVLWRKLQIDTRAKILQARMASVWGQKQQLEHSGDMQVQILTGVPQPDVDTGEDLLR